MSTTTSPQRKKLAPRNKNFVDSRKIQLGKGKLSKNVGKLPVFKEAVEQAVDQPLASLCSKVTPANYWKDMAEERRLSLEKALEENKDLSELLQTRNEEHKTLNDENEILLAENCILREKAQKVNELESLIAELVSASDDVSDPTDTSDADSRETHSEN